MKPRDYYVLTALWMIAQKRNKYAFQYSLQSLSRQTGISVKTCHKSIRILQKLGLVKVSKFYYTKDGTTRMRAIYHLNSKARIV